MQFLFGNHGTNPPLEGRVAVLSSVDSAKCDENARSTNQKRLSAKTHVPLSVTGSSDQQKGLICISLYVTHFFLQKNLFGGRRDQLISLSFDWLILFNLVLTILFVTFVLFPDFSFHLTVSS